MLDDYEKKKALGCVQNIYDKLDGINHELSLTHPCQGYLQEKIQPALHDMIVLNEIIQNINNWLFSPLFIKKW